MDAKALTQRIAAARRIRPDAARLDFRLLGCEVEPLLKSLRYHTGAAARHRRARADLEARIAALAEHLDRAMAAMAAQTKLEK